MTDRTTVDALIERIAFWPYGMRVRPMEQVLERGELSIAAISDALDRGQDDEERDLLWLVVLLGELRSPDAVPLLIRQLCRPDADILAQASAEARRDIPRGLRAGAGPHVTIRAPRRTVTWRS
jgi:hypothetical protein